VDESDEPQEQERALGRPAAPAGTAPEASGAGRPEATAAAFAGRIALLVPPAGARTRSAISKALRNRWAPRIALCLLLAFSVAAKAIDISQPCSGSCTSHSKHTLIFDEAYYVNAARVIDGIEPPVGDPYHGAPKGDDPNAEHPQLAKLVIAAGIDVFGDNPLGWRIGSIIFAVVALLALYALVTAAGGSSWLAAGTVAVMSLDNLMLVHGRIATLDIYAVAMMLVAGALYMRERPLLAGLALGVAACMKEVALFLVFVFILLEGVRIARGWMTRNDAQAAVGPAQPAGATRSQQIRFASWRSGGAAFAVARARLPRLGIFLLVGAIATLGLLWLLDVLVPAYDPGTHKVYAGNPFAHLAHMYEYANLLKSKPNETGITSSPLSWLFDEKAINYARVAVNTLVNGKIVGSHATISFQGLINPFIIFLAIPALFAAIASALRSGDELAALGACWCLGIYLPFLIGDATSGRVSYIYYMLLAMPGVYIVTTRLFASKRLPVAAAIGWGVALIYGFVHLYPIRNLL
jgi:Dolichyl-phosphate-mannose-protein mannosyltransferase